MWGGKQVQNTAFKAVAINILTVKKVAQSEEPTEIYHASLLALFW